MNRYGVRVTDLNRLKGGTVQGPPDGQVAAFRRIRSWSALRRAYARWVASVRMSFLRNFAGVLPAIIWNAR